jgi:hypothetical protein
MLTGCHYYLDERTLHVILMQNASSKKNTPPPYFFSMIKVTQSIFGLMKNSSILDILHAHFIMLNDISSGKKKLLRYRDTRKKLGGGNYF